MKIYHISPSGTFVGEGLAESDPRTGKPLVPANATITAPPFRRSRWDFDNERWVDATTTDLRPSTASIDLTDDGKRVVEPADPVEPVEASAPSEGQEKINPEKIDADGKDLTGEVGEEFTDPDVSTADVVVDATEGLPDPVEAEQRPTAKVPKPKRKRRK